jgi:hypothetical protein
MMRISFKTELKLNSTQITQLPRLGILKTYEYLPQELTPKTAIIGRTAKRWFVSFSYEVELKLKIAKQHARVANIPKDTLKKLTTHLAKNHSQVAQEPVLNCQQCDEAYRSRFKCCT